MGVGGVWSLGRGVCLRRTPRAWLTDRRGNGRVVGAQILSPRVCRGHCGPASPSSLLPWLHAPNPGRDTLHVEDTDVASVSRGGWLEDTSKVEKYVMSEDDYNSREGTYRHGSREGPKG